MFSNTLILRTLSEPTDLLFGGKRGRPFVDICTKKCVFYSIHALEDLDVLARERSLSVEYIASLDLTNVYSDTVEVCKSVTGHLSEVYAAIHAILKDGNERDIFQERFDLCWQAGYALDSFRISLELIESGYTHYTLSEHESWLGWFDCLDCSLGFAFPSDMESLRGFSNSSGVLLRSPMEIAANFAFSFTSFVLCPLTLPYAAITHYRRMGAFCSMLLGQFYLLRPSKWYLE